MNENSTNKDNQLDSQVASDDEMLPEYDFSGGVRGKHYRAYRQGHTVTVHHADGTQTVQRFQPDDGTITLDPDLRQHFPTSESVNEALRLVIQLTQVSMQATHS